MSAQVTDPAGRVWTMRPDGTYYLDLGEKFGPYATDHAPHMWCKDYGPSVDTSSSFRKWTLGYGGSPMYPGFDSLEAALASEHVPALVALYITRLRQKAADIERLLGEVLAALPECDR